MMHTDHLSTDWIQGPVTIRALHSLTLRDAEAVSQAVLALQPGWSVQTSDDYDGYLSIIVAPEDDGTHPTYLISGKKRAIDLAAMRDDNIVTLASCNTLHEIIAALIQQL
jgi:hypothetical protein